MPPDPRNLVFGYKSYGHSVVVEQRHCLVCYLVADNRMRRPAHCVLYYSCKMLCRHVQGLGVKVYVMLPGEIFCHEFGEVERHGLAAPATLLHVVNGCFVRHYCVAQFQTHAFVEHGSQFVMIIMILCGNGICQKT